MKPLASLAGTALTRIAQARHEIAWVLAGQLLAFAGGFAAIKLLTVLLGAQTYGRFALGLTLAGLCNMFVYGPLSQAVLRFYSICRERGQLDAYFAVAGRLYWAAGLGFAALAALAGLGVWLVLDDVGWAQIVVAALAVGIAAGTNGYLIAILSALRRRRAVALFQALDAWLKPVVALLVLAASGPDAGLALLAFFLGTLGVSAAQWLHRERERPVRRPIGAAARRPLRGELLHYSASMGVFSFFGAVSAYADRWIALGLAGEHDLGVYAAMYQIANVPFLVLLGIVTQLVTPALYDRAGEATGAQALARSDRLLGHTTAAAAVVIAAMVFAAWALARPTLLLLTTAEFAQQSELLAPIVLALGVFQFGQLHTLKGMYHNRPSIYFWPKALQALALVLCALALTRSYGLVGLVIALNVSSVLYLGGVLLANRRLSPGDDVAAPSLPTVQ